MDAGSCRAQTTQLCVCGALGEITCSRSVTTVRLLASLSPPMGRTSRRRLRQGRSASGTLPRARRQAVNAVPNDSSWTRYGRKCRLTGRQHHSKRINPIPSLAKSAARKSPATHMKISCIRSWLSSACNRRRCAMSPYCTRRCRAMERQRHHLFSDPDAQQSSGGASLTNRQILNSRASGDATCAALSRTNCSQLFRHDQTAAVVVDLVRPARLERATSWFVAGRRESTGGSGRPLPQCFRWSGNRPKPPETASSRRGLSAVCQSCDPLVMGSGRPVFWARRSLVFEANCQTFVSRFVVAGRLLNGGSRTGGVTGCIDFS